MTDDLASEPPYALWAQKYDALNEECVGNLVQHISRTIKRHFPDQETVSILDLGCGTGEILARLGSLVDPSSYGVDLSSDMIAIARAKDTRATFIVGNMLEHTAGDLFDIVLSTQDALNYLPPEAHAAFFERLQDYCHGGSLVYLDFDTAHDFEVAWDGQTHVFDAKTFRLTRQFSFNPESRTGTEVQTWEAKNSDRRAVKKEVHSLYPIHPHKFAEEAVKAGFHLVDFVDPDTGEIEAAPDKALRLGLVLRAN